MKIYVLSKNKTYRIFLLDLFVCCLFFFYIFKNRHYIVLACFHNDILKATLSISWMRFYQYIEPIGGPVKKFQSNFKGEKCTMAYLKEVFKR